MEKRQLGRTDVHVSVIAEGCWPMGGDYWGGTDDEESIRTVHKCLELGVTTFDTAPAYGSGHSEEVLGKALAGRRQEAVISTKASGRGLSEQDLRKKLQASFERLQTDYVDIYFVHWPSRSEPLAATMEALEKLRTEGLIRAIGVSNFTVDMLEMASRYGTVDCLQPAYNMIWRFHEEDVIPYCRKHQIGITTYSSLAQGLLTGTIDLRTPYRPTDMRPRSVLWKSENLGKCLYMVEKLRAVAKELDVSVSQLALRWLVSQPGVSTALVGARTTDELVENACAVGWDLSADDLARVQDISDELYDTMPYYYDMWENWSSWNKRGAQREV